MRSSVRTSLASAMSARARSTLERFRLLVGRQADAGMNPSADGVYRFEDAAKTLAAIDGDRHLDARLVADGAAKIGFAHQRPVDAGRGDLQPVGLREQVLDVERRRQIFARALAILDRYRPVGAFGHDLHGCARPGGDLHPDEPEAEIAQHGLGDAADPLGEAVVGDDARFVETLGTAGASGGCGVWSMDP